MFQTGAGQPIDDLDLLCQDWYNARKCLELENGVCSNGMDEEYEIPALVRMDPSNCYVNENLCLRTVCMVDLYFINEIYKHSLENRHFQFVDDAVCAADERSAIAEVVDLTDSFDTRSSSYEFPGGTRSEKRKVCTGTAPDALKIVTIP